MEKGIFSRKQIRIAALIGLLAFLIRVAFLIFYTSQPVAGGDPTAFWSYAQGIANGQGFSSTFEPWLADRPPLYSYVLAGIFMLFGESKTAVFVVQALLGSLSASLFYLCASRLMDDLGSVAAGVLFACLPHFLLFTQQILTEAIYIPLWVFLLASLLFSNRDNVSFKPILVTGVLLGLIALVRREAVLPGGLILFFGFGCERDQI
jgi:4-amino-4-deoxy-L-arabinose transferase-like glycosyltransferase